MRAGYPIAVKRLQANRWPGTGIRAPGEHDLARISTLTFRIRLGAGAFVCGEERALMNSIEGSVANPVPGLRSRR